MEIIWQYKALLKMASKRNQKFKIRKSVCNNK